MASKTAKMAQDGLQDGPRWPPSPPKRGGDASKSAQETSKTAQNGPRGAQEASKTFQGASERSSRRARRGQNHR
eukprot:9496321-Pyramimonas_sp.AAC.1